MYLPQKRYIFYSSTSIVHLCVLKGFPKLTYIRIENGTVYVSNPSSPCPQMIYLLHILFSTYLSHDATGYSQQRTDGKDHKRQLPAVDKSDDETGEEGRHVEEELAQLLTDAVLDLFNVTMDFEIVIV